MVGAKRQSNIITYVILSAGLLLIVVPLYITLVTAFKSNEQSSLSYFTLPDPVCSPVSSGRLPSRSRTAVRIS